MEKRARIFLVCALGTMTGLAVAWFVPEIVWWLGAIIGGVISGFLYALPEIKHYGPQAAKIAWRTLRYIPKIWHSFRKASVLNKWRVVATIILVGAFGGLFTGVALEKQLSVAVDKNLLTLFILAGEFYLFLPFTLLTAAMGKTEKIKKRRAKKALLFASPVGPLVAVGWIVIKAIKVAPTVARISARIVVEIVCFLVRFTKTLYLYIHSRELVLCTVDGALGVLISYILCVKVLTLPLGPTLLAGGLIGGLLGILNYEIVSKRILHLVPNEKT